MMSFAQLQAKPNTLTLCNLYFIFQFCIEVRVPCRAGITKMWLDNGIAQHFALCWCQKFIFTVKKFWVPHTQVLWPEVFFEKIASIHFKETQKISHLNFTIFVELKIVFEILKNMLQKLSSSQWIYKKQKFVAFF